MDYGMIAMWRDEWMQELLQIKSILWIPGDCNYNKYYYYTHMYVLKCNCVFNFINGLTQLCSCKVLLWIHTSDISPHDLAAILYAFLYFPIKNNTDGHTIAVGSRSKMSLVCIDDYSLTTITKIFFNDKSISRTSNFNYIQWASEITTKYISFLLATFNDD